MSALDLRWLDILALDFTRGVFSDVSDFGVDVLGDGFSDFFCDTSDFDFDLGVDFFSCFCDTSDFDFDLGVDFSPFL